MKQVRPLYTLNSFV